MTQEKTGYDEVLYELLNAKETASYCSDYLDLN